jgi:hypothetical protein
VTHFVVLHSHVRFVAAYELAWFNAHVVLRFQHDSDVNELVHFLAREVVVHYVATNVLLIETVVDPQSLRVCLPYDNHHD